MRKWMIKELRKNVKRLLNNLGVDPDLKEIIEELFERGLNLTGIFDGMTHTVKRIQEIKEEVEQKSAEIAVLTKEVANMSYPSNSDVISCYTAIATLCKHLSNEFGEDKVMIALARVVEDILSIRFKEEIE